MGKRNGSVTGVIHRTAASLGVFIARHHDEHTYVHRSHLKRASCHVGTFQNDRFWATADPVLRAGRTMLDCDRLYVLWQAVQNAYRVNGIPAGADVGTFRGGSAYFLASAIRTLKGEDAVFHCFDTFEGHPDTYNPEVDTDHKPGHHGHVDVEEVRAYLEEFPLLKVHKGDFSATVGEVQDLVYGVVHIDVNIHRSTRDCLRYYGARMAPGGVMVVDDFGAESCPGVPKAVSEFLEEQPGYQLWWMYTEQAVLVRQAAG